MAVRNELLGGTDWEDAETLYAADLNDTFDVVFPLVPIGSVFAWLKSLTNTPALPSNWVECNGQTLSDADSVYNGVVIPNLNGTSDADKLFLRGSTTSGTVGGFDKHNHQWLHSWTSAGAEAFVLNQDNSGTYDSYGERKDISGTSGSGYEEDAYTNNASSIPPSYEVVWIMRIK